MGLVMPKPGFLDGLRKAADRCGAFLIFDEVITGFRLGPTTYGNLCGVEPDLTCLGKIIGGGLPIGAVGGKREIMEHLAPIGKVYQAGTLSGNPVAIAAGMATIQTLIEEDPYPKLADLGRRLADGLNTVAKNRGIPMHCAQHGSIFTPFFTGNDVSNQATAKRCDTIAHAAFFHAMLDRGIYLPPSQFEVCFVSTAHGDEEIECFLEAARNWAGQISLHNVH
jgi:glutamate-1-semialdehyde 2,1-aminomutase